MKYPSNQKSNQKGSEKMEEVKEEKKARKVPVRRTPKERLTDNLNNAGVTLRSMFAEKSLTMERANAVLDLCKEYEALGKKIVSTLFPDEE